MKFSSRRVDTLPKLVWLAECRNNTEEVIIFHGPLVETGPGFCVAAVWDGDFLQAAFDMSTGT